MTGDAFPPPVALAPYPAGAHSSVFGAQLDGVGSGSEVSSPEVPGSGSAEVVASEPTGSFVVAVGSLSTGKSVLDIWSDPPLVEPLDVGSEVGLEDDGLGAWLDVVGELDVALVGLGAVDWVVFGIPVDVFVTLVLAVGCVVVAGSGSEVPQPITPTASRLKEVRNSGEQATKFERKLMSLDARDTRLDHGLLTRAPFASHCRICELTDVTRSKPRRSLNGALAPKTHRKPASRGCWAARRRCPAAENLRRVPVRGGLAIAELT